MVTKCGMPGCHGSSAPAVGLDLASAGVIGRLLGQPSNTAGNSVCSSNTKAFLVTGSTSGDGFLIDKLTNPPPCGTVMPQLPGPLNTTEMQCMKDWATAVTTGQIQ
jgi:hypothetical protein